jgi:phosphoglucosamine mutase
VKPDGGRVLLRYSGTEPKARLLIEGRDAAVLQQWSTQICDALKRQIGA